MARTFAPPVFAVACALCVPMLAAPAGAAVRTWAGTLSGDWHTDGNWAEGTVPGATDDAVVDGGYAIALTIDLTSGSITVVSLDIGTTTASEVAISGTGTGARVLTVSGDLQIGAFGTLTHPAHLGEQVERLSLAVNGNVTIAPGGAIEVSGRGYLGGPARGAGLGPGGGTGGYNKGASGGGHGGMGGDSDSPGGVAYGDIMAPTTLPPTSARWGVMQDGCKLG